MRETKGVYVPLTGKKCILIQKIFNTWSAFESMRGARTQSQDLPDKKQVHRRGAKCRGVDQQQNHFIMGFILAWTELFCYAHSQCRVRPIYQ